MRHRLGRLHVAHAPRSSRLAMFGCIAVACCAATPANAEVRSVDVEFEKPAAPPSFNPSPSLAGYLSRAQVGYDNEKGSLNARFDFYEPTSYAEYDFATLTCRTEGDRSGRFEFKFFPGQDGEIEEKSAYATVVGVEGRLSGALQVSPDKRYVTMQFASPLLRGLNWRCVSFGRDPAEHYFKGYSPSSPRVPSDTPRGYTWCGWRNLIAGGWTLGEPEGGAFMRVFGRGMSCASARRNSLRIRSERKPPYAPRLDGYRCVHLRVQHEFVDTRCTARTGPRRSLRVQSGA